MSREPRPSLDEIRGHLLSMHGGQPLFLTRGQLLREHRKDHRSRQVDHAPNDYGSLWS